MPVVSASISDEQEQRMRTLGISPSKTLQEAIDNRMNKLRDPETIEKTLGSDKWVRLLRLPEDTGFWRIHNRGSQNIYIGYQDNPPTYDTVFPDQERGGDTHPQEIWVQRSSSASKPTIVLTTWRGVARTGEITTKGTVRQATSEHAIAELGYYTGTSAAYQTLASWTVTAGRIGLLREIGMSPSAVSYGVAQFRLIIGSTTHFTDKLLIGAANFQFDGLIELPAGTVVTVSVKSDGATTIEAQANISGREV